MWELWAVLGWIVAVVGTITILGAIGRNDAAPGTGDTSMIAGVILFVGGLILAALGSAIHALAAARRRDP